jgi:1-acyl-sn-glycerol-3-phosphate acyltransferase
MQVRIVMPAATTGGSQVPASALPLPCVVVANHCSYLDGVLLAGVLPSCFSFVIKREMSTVPLAGLLLRRIGVEFMERRDQGRVLRDTRRVLRRAAGGQALVFFPEGTFSQNVGLLRFHIGAFSAAARAHLPLVPLAIRGTRHCLAPGSPWPRPGHIVVELLPPIIPLTAQGAGVSASAAGLREQARAALLATLGEPDLENIALSEPGGRHE